MEGPAAHLVRDVFLAADLMHEDAMSQMGGNSSRGGHYGESLDVAASDSASQSTECSMDAVPSMDGDPQG